MVNPLQIKSQIAALGAAWIGLAGSLSGCVEQPTQTQLDTWRQEARDRNAQLIAVHRQGSQEQTGELAIQGQTQEAKAGQEHRLDWQALDALATHHTRTTDALNVITPDAQFDFRGILVSKLLEQVQIDPTVTDVTFVSQDAYRVNIPIAELRRYPIAIALERDGKPIPKNQGGPLYLVFPHTQHPEIKQKYGAAYWAFYVTHLVLGTEPIRLRVGKREFNADDLNQLPQATQTEFVGFKIAWPNGKVKLQGVYLRDVLKAAGISLSSTSNVIIRGKPLIYHDATNPIYLSAAEVKNCDILLATRWGDDLQPIPAKLGGPVALAFPPVCLGKSARDQRWVTFVEVLEVPTL
ncbi:MAG: molybdopterin-dependent oxidoreductase [Leptolyngbyaceae bacterium]|nr:molybdopterin-dependent oxidoreductase [Leptolyngbyaceae bacterium]